MRGIGTTVWALALLGCAGAPAVQRAGAPTPPSPPRASAPETAGDGAERVRSEAERKRYNELVQQADTAAADGDLSRALQLLGDAKQLWPEGPPAYFAAGLLLYQAGRVASAAPEFKRTIELSRGDKIRDFAVSNIWAATSKPISDEEERFIKLGYQANEAHQADRALPPLQRALDLNPRNARTRFEIGYALIELKRIDEAITQLEEARRIDPVSRDVLEELQYCYGDRHRYIELGGVVRDRILVEGESAGLLHELGWSYAAQGNRAVGIATLEDNLRRNPTFYLSHYALGQLYCDEGREIRKGRTHLEAFLKGAEADLHSQEIGKGLVSPPKLKASIGDAHALLAKCHE